MSVRMVKKLLYVGLVCVVFGGCGQSASLKKGKVYKSIEGEASITVVSRQKMDVDFSGFFGRSQMECDYSVESKRVRVVCKVYGESKVFYFDVIKEGLKDEAGLIFYSPKIYKREFEKEQIRQEKLLKEEQAKKDKVQRQKNFIELIQNKNIDEIKKEINQGVDVNFILKSENNYLSYGLKSEKASSCGTPLCYAVESGNADIVKVLLKSGADVNLKHEGSVINNLRLAVKSKEKSIVALFLKQSVDVNEIQKQGQNVIIDAIDDGSADILSLLLDNGANPNLVGKESSYPKPLVYAIQEEKDKCVEVLLNHSDIQLEIENNEEISPVGMALRQRKIPLLKRLLTKKASPNGLAVDGYAIQSPLEYALNYDLDDVTRLLIKNGADVNAQHSNPGKPLALAIDKGKIELVQLILEKGADPNIGSSPLAVALNKLKYNKEMEKVASLLIEYGADVNAKSEGSWKQEHPLMIITKYFALEDHQMKVLQLLLEAGADVNAQGDGGQTVLHRAVSAQSLPVVRLLLKYKADPNIPDNQYEKTPLDYSLEKIQSYQNTTWGGYQKKAEMIHRLLLSNGKISMGTNSDATVKKDVVFKNDKPVEISETKTGGFEKIENGLRKTNSFLEKVNGVLGGN